MSSSPHDRDCQSTIRQRSTHSTICSTLFDSVFDSVFDRLMQCSIVNESSVCVCSTGGQGDCPGVYQRAGWPRKGRGWGERSQGRLRGTTGQTARLGHQQAKISPVIPAHPRSSRLIPATLPSPTPGLWSLVPRETRRGNRSPVDPSELCNGYHYHYKSAD